jgi:hypothetical protein
MISLKDIIMLGTLAGMGIPAGIYVHGIEQKVIVLAEDYIGDQQLRNQKEIWIYEEQVKRNPNDEAAQKRLRELEYEKGLLKEKKEKYMGGK